MFVELLLGEARRQTAARTRERYDDDEARAVRQLPHQAVRLHQRRRVRHHVRREYRRRGRRRDGTLQLLDLRLQPQLRHVPHQLVPPRLVLQL